ncbi:MAG: hypothetical protein WBZ57_04225 [Pseudomonas graminis]
MKTTGNARYGDSNARAQLTDSEVDLIRDLFDGDLHKPRGERFWTTHRLSLRFEISRSYVARLVRCEARFREE